MGESWMLPPPESVIGALAMQAFRASGLSYPRVTVVTLPGEARTKLLATGRFLTILATSTVRFSTNPPELKALPIELPLARVPIGVVTLKNRTLSPVARLFIEYAREVAKPLAKESRKRDVG
jgi:DNA-binding transcriptional LysR family regulator